VSTDVKSKMNTGFRKLLLKVCRYRYIPVFSTDQSNLWQSRRKAYWCKTVWTF